MGQELLNFRSAELARVPTIVERKVTPKPLQVSVLCSQGKMPGAHSFPRHREQAGLAFHDLILQTHLTTAVLVGENGISPPPASRAAYATRLGCIDATGA
jgi:hypothetical protein